MRSAHRRAALVGLLGLTACPDAPPGAVAAAGSACDTTVTDLIAGFDMDAGTVAVGHDEEELVIVTQVDDGWTLHDLQIDVACDVTGLTPSNGVHPDVLSFDYVVDNAAGDREVTLRIPRDEIGCDPDDTSLAIAVHANATPPGLALWDTGEAADVAEDDEGGDDTACPHEWDYPHPNAETCWARGEDYPDTSWAMYIAYRLEGCGGIGDDTGAPPEDDTGGPGDPPEDACETWDLGVAAGRNVLVFGDYRGGVDLRGPLTAGGDVEMTAFNVAEDAPGGDAMIVGGDLTLRHGTVHGDIAVRGAVSVDETVDVRGDLRAELPIDLSIARLDLGLVSHDLASLDANGATEVEAWGEITLTGVHPMLNVFRLDAADLAAANTLWLDAPAGSTVVVNVEGASGGMADMGIFLDGVGDQEVLWNFPDATTLALEAVGVRGTLLAPQADITFDNGAFDGGIVAASLTGDAEGHHRPFTGTLTTCD
jgi:choice-of-anchor A domain-containing protein